MTDKKKGPGRVQSGRASEGSGRLPSAPSILQNATGCQDPLPDVRQTFADELRAALSQQNLDAVTLAESHAAAWADFHQFWGMAIRAAQAGNRALSHAYCDAAASLAVYAALEEGGNDG